MSDYNPEEIQEASTKILNFPENRILMAKMGESGNCAAIYSHSFDTMLHELEGYKERVPFEEVKVPTLICHGDRDGDIPFDQAE